MSLEIHKVEAGTTASTGATTSGKLATFVATTSGKVVIGVGSAVILGVVVITAVAVASSVGDDNATTEFNPSNGNNVVIAENGLADLNLRAD